MWTLKKKVQKVSLPKGYLEAEYPKISRRILPRFFWSLLWSYCRTTLWREDLFYLYCVLASLTATKYTFIVCHQNHSFYASYTSRRTTFALSFQTMNSQVHIRWGATKRSCYEILCILFPTIDKALAKLGRASANQPYLTWFFTLKVIKLC